MLAATAAWSGMAIGAESLADESANVDFLWLKPAGTISTSEDLVGLDRALGMNSDAGIGLGLSLSPSWSYGFDIRAAFTTASFQRSIKSFNDYSLLGVDVDSSDSRVNSSWQIRQLDLLAVKSYKGLNFGETWELGIGARMIDSEFHIQEVGSQASPQLGNARLLDYRPLLHLGAIFPIIDSARIGFKAGSYPFGDSVNLDSSLWVEVDDPGTALKVRAGVRYLAYQYDNEDNVAYNTEAAGFTLSFVYDLGGVAWPSKADQDQDGVVDHKDRCPDTAPGAVVDVYGCAADEDRDGVANAIDACPNTPEGVSVDEQGCILDSDADGVPDGQDQCPDTPAGEPVESNGCSFDEDGDGVTDALDECPATPPGVVVDATGCGGDADGDGVADGFDQCPDTIEGLPVNAEGCAIEAAPIADCGVGGLDCAAAGEAIVLPSVQFASGRSVLTDDAKLALDDVAATMARRPDLVLEVQGHTDSVGNAADNQLLSEFRAQAVVDYLISVGVSAGRLSAEGFGDTQPVAGNDNPTGRALNRRVVIVVVDA